MGLKMSSSNPNSLPGIVTDQPEIFESEPALSDDTGINDLELLQDPTDDAIALIEVPIKQAFSYFAERENEIAQFYVQRHGEYKITGDKQDEETDLEKYHRLVAEVNQLLNKFQADKLEKSDKMSVVGALDSAALIKNLDILSRQLKALESAAADGSLSGGSLGFENIETKLGESDSKSFHHNTEIQSPTSTNLITDETSKLIHMSALERRLNLLETVLGYSDSKAQALFKATKCESLTEVAETLGSWLSLFKPDSIQRVSKELDYLTQRMDKINEHVSSGSENNLDPQSKAKLEQLCDLVTTTDKYRAMVPAIIHRLNAMEDLQAKANQIVNTMTWIEQKQSEIIARLQVNKEELDSLPKNFNDNIDLLRKLSNDIEARIHALRDNK